MSDAFKKKFNFIPFKNNILIKLGYNKHVNHGDISRVVNLFLKEYSLHKWACNDIESLVSSVKDLISSKDERDLIIACSILKNLQKK